ncbi:ABC transporter permease [uncultured Ruegeria sp.]|uniref:ABC transporter permease n=1 Tax=uncultured Ruegeria sp. TaxID=259304 RepID=UPI002622EFAA|nr:ABC transporter permease [uncultured Ruegeria sp.]
MMMSTKLIIALKSGYNINYTGLICSAVVLFWACVALIAPLITPYPVGEIVDWDYFGPSTSEFWFGTDYLGRDVFSRVLMGTRYTVGISLAAGILTAIIGVSLGMTAAVVGGIFDQILSRFLDAFTSIPSKLFGIVVVATVGSSIPTLIFTLAAIYIPGCYRIARALAVNVNTMEFVTVARARGESTAYLIREEILPNILGPILSDFGLRFSYIVLLLSGLSFLGMGVQPPNADWGALVKENVGALPFGAPAIIYPSLAIASLTIAVNMLIDNLPRKIRDREG